MTKKKISKIAALSIFIVLIIAMTIDILPAGKQGMVGRGSSFVWEDDFIDTNKIDTQLSYNYVVSGGNVLIDNTYEAWVAYPEWERMKPIYISNSGSEIIDYVLDLTVEYDSDMQWDFDDLRFANETGSTLLYNRIKKTNGVSANVLVRMPVVPSGETTIYMFYGNPTVGDASTDIFTWTKLSGQDDIPVSYTYSEGCWDPSVEFGNNKFLTAWEEGLPPEWLEGQGHRLNRREIHGRLYDENGGNPNPPPGTADLHISIESPVYHSENPSIAYSSASDKFFVTWEQNPIITRWAVGIEGALVRRSDGYVYTSFTICDPLYYFLQYYPQFDPCVAYDDQSDRFFVVWEGSDTSWNFDVWGRIYSSGGSPITSKFQVASGSTYQGQPWICSDDEGHFLVVYEDGPDSENGPFSLKCRLFDSGGNQIGSTNTIATGSSDTDRIYPSVSYSPETERYLVVWNTGDVSDGDYNGEIHGRTIDQNGDLDSGIFTVQYGSVYKIAKVVPYHSKMFFSSYDNGDGIWGRLVSSDALLVEDRFYLCDTLADGADWNDIAVSDGNNVYSVWEDERYLGFPPTAVMGSVWECDQSIGFSSIECTFGNEEELILEAIITSIKISPEDWQSWEQFFAEYTLPGGTYLQFDIMNESGTLILKEDASSGEDISDIEEPIIRLRGTLTRDTPSDTPILDKWNVTALIGGDIEPPWTVIELDPETPNGNNGWYVSSIEVTLTAYDNDTPPENVTTFYRINGGEVIEYVEPFELSEEGPDNSIEYWSIDSALNEELPHNMVGDIKIDLTAPFVTILEPPELVFEAEVTINGTVAEYGSGSSIDQIIIKINDEIVFDQMYDEEYFVWFDMQFVAEYYQTYEIHVEAYDKSGKKGEDHVDTTLSDRGLYEPGYIYLLGNPKIGPISILVNINLAVAVDYDSLYIVLPEFHENASSVEFVVKQLLLKNEFTDWDRNLTDGCSINFKMPLPIGFYEIKAYAYDTQENQLEEYLIIAKIFVIQL